MLGLLVLVLFIGVVAWLVESNVEMAQPFKQVWRLLLVIIAVYILWLAVGSYVRLPVPLR